MVKGNLPNIEVSFLLKCRCGCYPRTFFGIRIYAGLLHRYYYSSWSPPWWESRFAITRCSCKL